MLQFCSNYIRLLDDPLSNKSYYYIVYSSCLHICHFCYVYALICHIYRSGRYSMMNAETSILLGKCSKQIEYKPKREQLIDSTCIRLSCMTIVLSREGTQNGSGVVGHILMLCLVLSCCVVPARAGCSTFHVIFRYLGAIRAYLTL